MLEKIFDLVASLTAPKETIPCTLLEKTGDIPSDDARFGTKLAVYRARFGNEEIELRVPASQTAELVDASFPCRVRFQHLINVGSYHCGLNPDSESIRASPKR